MGDQQVTNNRGFGDMNGQDVRANKSSLRDLAYIFFRRKWVILAVFLATVIPVTVYTLRIPASYEAKARLLVKPGRENIYVSPVGSPEGTHPPTIVQRVAELKNSEIQILQSRILLERVVRDIGLAKFDPGFSLTKSGDEARDDTVALSKAVSHVLSRLTAESMEGTDVIEIAFRASSPETAFDFVNKWIEDYLERHVEVHQSSQSFGFFKSQAEQLKETLLASARGLADFEKKYSLVSFDAQKNLVLNRFMTSDGQAKEIAADIKAAEKKVEKLKQDLAQLPAQRYLSQEEYTDTTAVSDLKTKLADLEVQRADLLHRYKPDNFNVVRVNDTIAQIQKMLAEEEERFHGQVTTGANKNYNDAESEIMALETELAALQIKSEEVDKQLIEYGKELERLGRLEPDLRNLQRTVDINEQTYKLYLTKFEESRVSEAMDAAKMVSVSVLEPPTFPRKPVPIRTGLNIFVSLCIGCLAGIGLGFLAEYFDHTLKVPEEIETLIGLTPLGAVEDLPEDEKVDVNTLAASPTAPQYYEILKGNVKTQAAEKQKRILSICAPTPGEGASTVALNLAAALSKDKGQRVLLIDANLRDPSFHASFNLPISAGLSDVILDGADAKRTPRETVIPNLFVLTAGTSPPNPVGLFESPKLVDFVKAVREDFDWIIFDGAAVNSYPETAVLASKVEGTILVVEAENKRAEVALQAKERLEAAGGSILGAILNRRRFVIPEAIYRRL